MHGKRQTRKNQAGIQRRQWSFLYHDKKQAHQAGKIKTDEVRSKPGCTQACAVHGNEAEIARSVLIEIRALRAHAPFAKDRCAVQRDAEITWFSARHHVQFTGTDSRQLPKRSIACCGAVLRASAQSVLAAAWRRVECAAGATGLRCAPRTYACASDWPLGYRCRM